jgi:hypothetical protein
MTNLVIWIIGLGVIFAVTAQTPAPKPPLKIPSSVVRDAIPAPSLTPVATFGVVIDGVQHQCEVITPGMRAVTGIASPRVDFLCYRP